MSAAKPNLVLPASIDDPELDDETTAAMHEISKVSHARRATLAAMLSRADDGVSAPKSAGMTGYSDRSVRTAWDDLEARDLDDMSGDEVAEFDDRIRRAIGTADI